MCLGTSLSTCCACVTHLSSTKKMKSEEDGGVRRLTCSLTAAYKRVRSQLSWNIVVLSLLIAVVWCMLSLPIVFYHHRLEDATGEPSTATMSCESYSGQVCAPVLNGLNQCIQQNNNFSAESYTAVSVWSGNQRKIEILVKNLLSFLYAIPAYNKSEQCKAAAYPFTCQYFLPQCAAINGTIRPLVPSRGECVRVLNLCAEQLKLLVAAQPGVASLLPDCKLLPIVSLTSSCKDNYSTVPKTSCREDFSEVDGVCLARCDSWEQSSHSEIVAVRVAFIFGSITALIGGSILVAVSCFRRRIMFGFPSAFIVYQTLCCCAIALLLLVNYAGRDGLFCTEKYVLDALENATPFCTISGVGRQYCVLSFTLWWFFHVCCLFWKVVFPIHSRGYQHKYKYIHIVLVIAGLILPLPSVIAAFATGGYSINQFPALLCGLEDQDTEYYSLWLVMNLLQIAGITLLILLTYRVHKHQGLFSQNATAAKLSLSRAEKKLIFVFGYYTIFATLTLVFYSITTSNYSKFEEAVIEYFSCEAGGYNPIDPCPKSYEQYTYPELQAAVYVVMGFVPTVNLIYVIDAQRMRQGLSERFPSLSGRFSKANLNSSPGGKSNASLHSSSPGGKSNLSLHRTESIESKNWVSTVN